MQTELKATMETLAVFDSVAKTCAVVAVLTLAAPASLPATALYAGCTAAGLSLWSDEIKVVAALSTGNESPVSLSDVATNALTAGVNAAVSAAIFGHIFSKIGLGIGKGLSSYSVVETQARRLIENPTWSTFIVERVGGGSMNLSRIIPHIVASYLRLMGRLAWGSLGGVKGVKELIERVATCFIEDNPEALNTPSEDVLASTIANEILDDAMINSIFDVILSEHTAEFEKLLAEELEGVESESLP